MVAFLDRRHVLTALPALLAPLLVTFLGTAAASADASGDKPGDYAQVIPLTVSGKQAIVQLPLPAAVYLGARAPDLRDLRVFDAAGKPMPFALTAQQQPGSVRRTTAPVAVFPVHAPADAAQRLQDRLQIRTGQDGAVISVTAPAARGADDVLASLVLDLRPATQAAQAAQGGAARVAGLVLTLPPGLASYSAELLLETSDDLQHWEELAQASVSWLANDQGATVRKDRIAFEPTSFRYARLRWLDGRPVAFAAVQAEYLQQLGAPPRRDSIVLQAAPGTQGQDLVYAAPVAVPVEALGLQLAAQNVVLPALVGQYQKVRRGDGKVVDELRPIVNTTFYQMMQDGRLRASGDIEIAPTHAAQWVLRPQGPLAERPGLRLRWTPAAMVFLAGGQAPYTLAVGRDGVAATQVPLSQVAPGFSAQELGKLELAKAGIPVQQRVLDAPMAGLGGGARHSAWLWALLLCGVAALAAMAWRLSRQLRDAPRA